MCTLASGGESNWPHTISDELLVENRLSNEVRDDLAARGHRMAVCGPLDGRMGRAMAIVRLDDGMLLAGADPRGDGQAAAY